MSINTEVNDEENYTDSTQNILEHIELVRKNINYLVNDLNKRAEFHDQTKLEEPEKSAFDREVSKLKTVRYGTDEYEQCLARLREALQHHYKHNSHHPEHYDNGINGMDLMDIVEMVCDWKAASDKSPEGGNVDLDYNVKRFGIDNQLRDILHNTLRRYFNN